MAAPAAIIVGAGGGGPVGAGGGLRDQWQMNCCLSCFGPFSPSRVAMRKDRVGSRALNYIEGQICMHRDEWNCLDEPKLSEDPNNAHLFHETNVEPVINLFRNNGPCANLWLDFYTNKYNRANNNQLNVGMAVGQSGIKIKSQANWRLVAWNRPMPIPGIGALYDLVEQCLNRIGAARVLPNPGQMERICKACNDIMTQGSTTSELLVRTNLNPNPLVPIGAIYRYNLNVTGPNQYQIASARMQDPSLAERNGRGFSYQACLAYYIHRCLPREPVGLLPPPGPLRNAELRRRDEWREITVSLSFVLLEICSLMCENEFGSNGGRTVNPKPSYRYKGMIELYVSYYLWILASNDVPGGVPNFGVGCSLDFCLFHRYYFANLLDYITLAWPEHAGAVDIRDIIFPRAWILGGAVPLAGRMRLGNAENVIGFLAQRLRIFYLNMVRNFIARMTCGLAPDPTLLNPPIIPANRRIYDKQVIAYNMLITEPDLVTLTRLCERGTSRDIDSFINTVGIHAVLHQWAKLLQLAPQRADKLIYDFMDTWTMHEYNNILKSLSRESSGLPKITTATAESIYLMCNVVNAPSEPSTEDELELLRSAPKCIPAKAALRLIQVGAFQEDDI